MNSNMISNSVRQKAAAGPGVSHPLTAIGMCDTFMFINLIGIDIDDKKR